MRISREEKNFEEKFDHSSVPSVTFQARNFRRNSREHTRSEIGVRRKIAHLIIGQMRDSAGQLFK